MSFDRKKEAGLPATVVSAETMLGVIETLGIVPFFENPIPGYSIEEMTVDYIGNMWFASSQQGVMKITPTPFTDIYDKAGLAKEVVNATCLYDGKLFIGTNNNGLKVLKGDTLVQAIPIKKSMSPSGILFKDTDLIKLFEGDRIRCLMKDSYDRLWICTFGDNGLVCYANGIITKYTTADGMPSNRIRSVSERGDGAVMACCTGGVAIIKGGKGVGRVTRPGLDQPVGEAAINSVPREMITREVTEVLDMFDCSEAVTVTISVPEGEELALHTFNPRLGIEGGISIIGTSGVVEPMSRQAILDTIRVELRQKRAEGHDIAFISPGNYGLDFMKETYDVDLDRSVKCSNFVGETIDMICELGFSGMLLTGHIGKLVKVAGGIMNTHSREADCRMEIIAAAAVREGADTEVLGRILDCLTTEEAYGILYEVGLAEKVSQRIMDRIMYNLDRRAGERLDIGSIVYSKEYGQLAASDRAAGMIEENRNKWNG